MAYSYLLYLLYQRIWLAIDDLQKFNRGNNIILSGIADKGNVIASNKMTTILSDIDVQVKTDNIKACHRKQK